MKILIAHNSYQHRGGEDVVANAEIELLRSHGHDVAVYRRDNSEIHQSAKISTALSTVWSQKSVREIDALIDSFHPDLIHAHNTFPLISPSLYWTASRRRIPVVQTLHNFRLLCPQAMFLRENKACEDCLGKLPWRAVTRKCYRGSAAQSAVALGMLAAHRMIGTYRTQITTYIALSNFSREKFIAGGLPAERIHIKPNFVKQNRVPEWNGRRGALFVGRLSFEKGLDTLMDARMRLQALSRQIDEKTSIKIVGAGPLESVVNSTFGNDYLGFRAPADLADLQHASLFQVAPSTCYETFGMVAVEAFSCGVPVIASAHGGLGELVTDGVTGLLFKPGDAGDLAEKIAWAHAHPEEMLKMGRAAYTEYLKKYTPEANYQALADIYRQAMLAMQGAVYVT